MSRQLLLPVAERVLRRLHLDADPPSDGGQLVVEIAHPTGAGQNALRTRLRPVRVEGRIVKVEIS